MNEIERICGDIADMLAPNGKVSAYLCVASYQHEMPHHTGFAPTNPLGGVMHWSDDSHYRRANSETKPPQQPDVETSRLDESDTAMWSRAAAMSRKQLQDFLPSIGRRRHE